MSFQGTIRLRLGLRGVVNEKKPAVHHHGLNYILTQAGISSETTQKGMPFLKDTRTPENGPADHTASNCPFSITHFGGIPSSLSRLFRIIFLPISTSPSNSRS